VQLIRPHIISGGLLTCIDMIMARRIIASMAISVALIIYAFPAFCQDLIISAHENSSLDNCTLQIVDIDTQAAKVWLVISDPTGPILSEILGENDTLSCDNQTLTVTRIYSGESSDLVFLRINRSD
jgi:hypothetical protein